MVIINSLWIGGDLSRFEHACLKSHVLVGHEHHLWCYSPIKNIPDGIIIRDGREILPEKDIFVYKTGHVKGTGSYAAFSNIFRYKLLFERGGWWSDVDVAAIKKWDFNKSEIIALEESDPIYPATCVIKTQKESKLAKFLYKKSRVCNKDTLIWGHIGPILMTEAIYKLGLHSSIVAKCSFCPIRWQDYEKLITDNIEINKDCTYGIHFWNQMWRRHSLDKEKDPPITSIYGRLLHDTLCNDPTNYKLITI